MWVIQNPKSKIRNIFYRKIRSKRYPSNLLKKFFVSIGTLYSHRPQSIACPIHIACCMRWLYRRNDVVFTKKIEVVLVDHLRVFNPPAQIIFLFQIFSVDLQNSSVATISNGMSAHLPTMLINVLCYGVEMLQAAQQKPKPPRLIAIRM